VPIPNIIPGWTFTGGAGGVGEELCPGLGCSTFGDGIPGDSGTEGGGNPGNEILLSTLDGRVFQTSGFNIVSIPSTQKYEASFDTHNIFTPTGQGQLTARLYYVDGGGNRQPLSTFATPALGDFQRYTVEIVGGSPALTPALGRPIGIEFDTTSREFDGTVTESWAGIDNVLLQITGVTAGDLNGDGLVNSADYAFVRNNQQTAKLYKAEGELTGDGFVDLEDFRAFKDLFAAGAGAGGGSLGASVPEPSSLLTIVAAAVGIGLATRRRAGLSNRTITWSATALFMAALLLCSESKCSAELLAYEPFNTPPYNVGPATLEGQSSPSSYFSGPWTIGTTGEIVVAESLSYLGSPSQGGSVTSLGEGRAGIFLADPWDDTTEGTFYIGYQASYGTAADPMATDGSVLGFRTTEFWPVGNIVGQDDGRSEVGFQGFAGDNNQRLPQFAQLRFVTPGGDTQFLTDTVFNDFGGTHLIVLKYVLSATANMDSISVFLDPTSSVEPDLPQASASGLNYTLGAISTISKFGNTGGVRPVFDELRIGTTFIDVIPELPLPGDTNGDGEVDIIDFNAIVAHLNLSNQTTANGDVAGANGKQGSDGRVDLRDLALWRANRTDLPGAGSGAGVPEPSSLILIVLAASAIGFVRRIR
jgi:hypothetical protein